MSQYFDLEIKQLQCRVQNVDIFRRFKLFFVGLTLYYFSFDRARQSWANETFSDPTIIIDLIPIRGMQHNPTKIQLYYPCCQQIKQINRL